MIRRDNFTIPQGADWSVKWDLVDPQGKKIPTEGWTVRSHVRRRHTSAEILHEWSSALGNAEITDGAVILRVANSVSAQWTWKTAVYDVEIVSPEGFVIRLTQGNITVSPEVTR